MGLGDDLTDDEWMIMDSDDPMSQERDEETTGGMGISSRTMFYLKKGNYKNILLEATKRMFPDKKIEIIRKEGYVYHITAKESWGTKKFNQMVYHWSYNDFEILDVNIRGTDCARALLFLTPFFRNQLAR